MQNIKDIRNDLLKRQEVSIILEAEKNPGFEEMKKKISEEFKKPEEVVDVYNIKGSFGSKEFKIDAYIYDSKEDLEKNKPKKKVKKGEEKKEEKAAEESKDTKEAPVEEKQEASDKGGAPAEEKQEVEEKTESKPEEAPVEERPEEETKAVEESKQAEQEAKEP